MRFSMLYSGEQNLSFKSCLVFYAGDSLSFLYGKKAYKYIDFCDSIDVLDINSH